MVNFKRAQHSKDTFLVRVELKHDGAHPYRCKWQNNAYGGDTNVFKLPKTHASFAELLEEINASVGSAFTAGHSDEGQERHNLGQLNDERIKAVKVMWDYSATNVVVFQHRREVVPMGGGITEVSEWNWRGVVESLGRREGRDVKFFDDLDEGVADGVVG